VDVTALPRLQPGQVADVGLLLEGTYPYVSGGVSSWVHEIVSGLAPLTFGVVFIGSAPEDYRPIRYALPPNLVHVETHYLSEAPRDRPARGASAHPEHFAALARLHDQLRQGAVGDAEWEVATRIETPDGVGWQEFLASDETWQQVCSSYQRFCTSPSFVDYFWTVRTMHGPLFKMAQVAAGVPQFRVFHAVSTGYAGFLGALLQRRRGRPLILTEHGIYTKERKIDLAHAGWIKDAREDLTSSLEEDRTYVRRLWGRFFEDLGRLTYASARPIISLYEGNRNRQIADGAPAERTRVVPNGIDLGRFTAAPRPTLEAPPRVLALIGRVVPIKDVRGFIRAMRSVLAVLPDAQGWIVGPEDEDPTYAQECRDLIASLGLGGRVKLLGFRKPEELFPQLGLTVLTSISEALPLVVLESFASGVPVVATDVGACRELIEGREVEDRALGAAGAVVPIASPEAAARAMVRLLTDKDAWWSARQAGLERVRAHYTRAQMFAQYRAVYDDALEEARGGDRVRAP
jgi:glycosyltransferase involved in cell wall biosynthesis